MIKEIVIEATTDILIVVMAADLLYLYFIGSWYDPIAVIEISELILLFSAVVFGCYRLVRFIRFMKRIDIIKYSGKNTE